jgi:hypothetical protein
MIRRLSSKRKTLWITVICLVGLAFLTGGCVSPGIQRIVKEGTPSASPQGVLPTPSFSQSQLSSQSALVSFPLPPSDGFNKLIEKKTVKSPRGLEIFFDQFGEMNLAETPGVEVMEGSILSFEPSEIEESRLIISSNEGAMTFTFNDAESTFFLPEGTNLEAGSKLKIYYREKNGKLYVVLAVGLKR